MRRLGLALSVAALAPFAAAAPPSWADSITERLPGSFLGLLTWQWLALLVLVFVSLILHEVVRFTARKMIRLRERMTGKKTETGEHGIRRGAGLLGFVLLWYLFIDS